MGKKRQTLSLNKVTVKGATIPKLTYTDLGVGAEAKYLINREDDKGNLIHIATTPSREINKFNQTEIEFLLMDAFKKITCGFCSDEWSALWMTETPIGIHACRFCWNQFRPPIQWKVLDNLIYYGNK